MPQRRFNIANSNITSWGQVATDAVSVLLSTALIIYLFLFAFIYLAIAALWIAVLNSSAGPALRSIQFSKSIDTIGSIFIFIYLYIWLSEAINGYSDGPTKLRQILYDIGYLTNHITTAMTKKQLDVKGMEYLRNHIHSMIVSIFRLFLGTDLIHHNLSNRNEIDTIIKSYEKKYGHDNLIISTSIALQVQKWVHALEEDVIATSHLDVFDSTFDLIMKALRDIDSATRVNKPYIFRGHLIFALYLYFIFWLPLLVDMVVGDIAMLILYPILMLILTGPIIYRTWLGEPFDLSNSPLRYNNYFDWFVEYVNKVNLFCKSVNE